MFKDIKVGDTVWVKQYSKHYGRENIVVQEVVTSVSKLYFYTGTGSHRPKYYKDSGKLFSIYSTCIRAYLSEQDIKDEKELAELLSFMHNQFSWRGSPITLNQLRRIKAIIDEPIKP